MSCFTVLPCMLDNRYKRVSPKSSCSARRSRLILREHPLAIALRRLRCSNSRSVSLGRVRGGRVGVAPTDDSGTRRPWAPPTTTRKRDDLGHRAIVEVKRDVGRGLEGLAYCYQVRGDLAFAHLDPIHNIPGVLRLKKELLALRSHPHHVLPLHVIRSETALRVL